MSAIPVLLKAQDVLHKASSRPSDVAGGEGQKAVSSGTANESGQTSHGPGPANNTPLPEQSGTSSESVDDEVKGAEEGHPIDAALGSPLSPIFAIPPEDDATRAELQNIVEDLRMNHAKYSLHDAAGAWKRVTAWGRGDGLKDREDGDSQRNYASVGRGVLSGLETSFSRPTGKAVPLHLSRMHIRMLQRLSKSPDLVGWLVQVRFVPEE